MKKESIMNRKHFYIIAGIFILALAGCSIKKEDTKKIQDILTIVKYTYNIELNDNSLNYERFVTHLRFFFKRLKDRELAEDKDDFLLKQVKNKYKNAYNCMLKIEKYLNVELTDEEKLYLTLHVQRVTQR